MLTVSHRVLKIPLDQELTVAVRPNVMTTSEKINIITQKPYIKNGNNHWLPELNN